MRNDSVPICSGNGRGELVGELRETTKLLIGQDHLPSDVECSGNDQDFFVMGANDAVAFQKASRW